MRYFLGGETSQSEAIVTGPRGRSTRLACRPVPTLEGLWKAGRFLALFDVRAGDQAAEGVQAAEGFRWIIGRRPSEKYPEIISRRADGGLATAKGQDPNDASLSIRAWPIATGACCMNSFLCRLAESTYRSLLLRIVFSRSRPFRPCASQPASFLSTWAEIGFRQSVRGRCAVHLVPKGRSSSPGTVRTLGPCR